MRQKGISQIPILVILLILVIAASAASYYVLKSAGKAPSRGIFPLVTPTPTPSVEISDSDEPDVIESELDTTSLESVDNDLKDLETSAASL